MLDARAQKLVDALPKGFEAALIGSAVSRFYLLDFDAGDAGVLLLLPGEMLYIIDSRYIESAQARVQGARVQLEEDRYAQLAGALKAARVKKLYLEDAVPIAEWQRWADKIPNVEFDITPTLSKSIMALRQIKDAEELRRMREAQRITDACFAHILPFIKPGVREVDLVLEMEHFMRSNGAEGAAFDTICVGGQNSSLPHGTPGGYRLQNGDFLTMDFGARVQGYCADMTRTVALGEPGAEKRKVYDTVLRAHLAGLEAAAAGKTCGQVDAAARDVIRAAGYGDAFGHGLGHAVGIEVHEPPRFSPKSADTALAGMMLTVEPGIYLPGRFGCRIEDTVLIREGGCTPLPTSPKELLVL